jgi:hypothetical protein
MSLEHAPQRQKQQAAPRGSFTIDEWCERHRVNRSYWYTLKRLGLGPHTMDLNGMTRISVEADERWTREREEAAA